MKNYVSTSSRNYTFIARNNTQINNFSRRKQIFLSLVAASTDNCYGFSSTVTRATTTFNTHSNSNDNLFNPSTESKQHFSINSLGGFYRQEHRSLGKFCLFTTVMAKGKNVKAGDDDNNPTEGNILNDTSAAATPANVRRSSRQRVSSSPNEVITSTNGKPQATTKKRKSATNIDTLSVDKEVEEVDRDAKIIAKSKATKRKSKSIEEVHSDESGGISNEKPADKKTTAKSRLQKSPDKSKSKKQIDTDNDEMSSKIGEVADPTLTPVPQEKATKPKKSPSHQVLTQRDEIVKLWNDDMAAKAGSYTFRIASWNVAGLRAVLNKAPNTFVELAQKHNLDVLCLQETKLQESHIDDPKLNLRSTIMLEDSGGYDAYYSCSTAKKGYSGTAIFVKHRDAGGKSNNDKKKQTSLTSFFTAKETTKDDDTSNPTIDTNQALPIDVSYLIPENVSYKMGNDKHDQEGRFIVLDYKLFTICNVYVPNSGQNLDRLQYRTDEWDKDFLAFMQQKQKERNVPVVWLGDLNVAHTNLEVWNDGAKHLAKQAGVTVEERESFQQQLDSGFIDAFRKLHPTAAGHYSYWSQRAGNRQPNKGLRLDYFICDPQFFDESSQVIVRDSYIDHEQEGSDHCPVILEIEIKKSK